MYYCNVNDIRKVIDQSSLVELTDDSNQSIDEQKINEAIVRSSSLIDRYISKRYELPLSDIPAVLVDICSILSIKYLYRYRNIESELWNNNAKEATSILEKLASGELKLQGSDSDNNDSDRFLYQSSGRAFSRSSLRRM